MIYKSAPGRRKTYELTSISREQLTNLRVKAQKVEEMDLPRVTMRDHLNAFWTMIISSFMVQNRQCRYYGHVLPPAGWVAGIKPRCADCHAEVSDPNDLRKAEPRQ